MSEGKFTLGGLALFAFWLFVALPFLYGPPPRVADTRHPSQAHSEETNQDRAQKPDGSEAAPFFIRIPKTAEEAAQEAEERKEKSSTDWWLMIFTGAVALFTFALVGATLALWVAGEKQRELAADTARRQLQAYVSLSPNKFGGLFNGQVGITFDVKNSGQTPAFNLNHRFRMQIFPNPLPPGFEFPVAELDINLGTTVAPGGSFEMRFGFNIPDLPWHLGEIAANRERIHCWGASTFLDVFNITRTTRFSASAGGSNFVEGQMAYADGIEGPDWGWDYGPNHNHVT